VNKTNSQYCV